MLLDQDLTASAASRGPRRRTIGLIASGEHARVFLERLIEHGFHENHVFLLSGLAAIPLWEQLIGSDQWGEQAEMLHDQGLGTLKEEGTIFVVDVANQQEAGHVADIAAACGGHTVHYFGDFVDTQLTA
jgi:hypothetical protein